jgi:hypothetical protein
MNQVPELPSDAISRVDALAAWADALAVNLLDVRLRVQRQLVAGEPVDFEAIDHALAVCERLDDLITRARATLPVAGGSR